MNIKEAVTVAYDQLPNGVKKTPSEIYGCHYNYFKRIVNGKIKDKNVYYKAFDSIIQAARDHKEDVIAAVKTIEYIKIDNQEGNINVN